MRPNPETLNTTGVPLNEQKSLTRKGLLVFTFSVQGLGFGFTA